jgi:hypothetical protein
MILCYLTRLLAALGQLLDGGGGGELFLAAAALSAPLAAGGLAVSMTVRTVPLVTVQILCGRPFLAEVFIVQLGQAKLHLKPTWKVIPNVVFVYMEFKAFFNLALFPVLWCVLDCILEERVVLAGEGLPAGSELNTVKPFLYWAIDFETFVPLCP